MTSLAPGNPSDSNSETMINQNIPFNSIAGRNDQPQAISRSSTEQRVEVVPVSNCVCREPDIIYLKQPILNSVSSGPAFSVKAYAKLPDDWLESKLEEKSADIPIATNKIVEDTVNLDEKCTTRETVSGENATVQSCAADVTTNIVDTKCNTAIKVESVVTTTAVASGGVTFKATVNTNTKLTLPKKSTGASSQRYVIQARVHIKIVLQQPMSSNTSVTESHSERRG